MSFCRQCVGPFIELAFTTSIGRRIISFIILSRFVVGQRVKIVKLLVVKTSRPPYPWVSVHVEVQLIALSPVRTLDDQLLQTDSFLGQTQVAGLGTKAQLLPFFFLVFCPVVK